MPYSYRVIGETTTEPYEFELLFDKRTAKGAAIFIERFKHDLFSTIAVIRNIEAINEGAATWKHEDIIKLMRQVEGLREAWGINHPKRHANFDDLSVSVRLMHVLEG